jgi:hypothetical protein
MVSMIRTCMGLSFGAWLTGMLWLLVRNPWVSVFIVGVMLGLALLEGGVEREKSAGLLLEVAELQKQVVSLRTTLGHLMYQEESVVDTRARFRYRKGPGSSSSL